MLSICIIVKNEEKQLENCIKSVLSVADEIILVDTGSTDNTISIGHKYTDKIYNFKWNGDFSEARNFSLSKAKGDFIFIIDADEILLNPESVIKCTKSSLNKSAGFVVTIQSIAEGNNGFEYMNSAQIRLFKNNILFKYEGIIHEQIADSIAKSGFEIENSDIILKHFGYNLSENQKKLKHERNIELLEKAMQGKPSNELRFYIAKELSWINDFYNSLNLLNKIIFSEKSNSALLIASLNLASFLSYKIKRNNDSLNYISASLEFSPTQTFANFVKAEIKNELKEYQEALGFYRAAYFSSLNINHLVLAYGEYYIPSEMLKLKIAKVLLNLKRYSEAVSEFDNILTVNPNNKKAAIGLANAYFKIDNFIKCKSILIELINKYPDDKEIKKYIIQSGLFKEDFQIFKEKSISKPLLTLSMIVKNEEKHLKDCIQSALPFVDEIVIVDTGSTDDTIQIAKSFGAKIIEFEWNNNFSDARNEALKYSTGEWILYLDADERIQPVSKPALKSMLLSAPDEIGGYLCIIESEHSKEIGGTEMHRGGYPRLFRNYGYPQIQFTGKIHEQITPSIKALGKFFTNSGIIITHLGYNLTPEEMNEKVRRNYEMLISQVAEEPLNGYAWFQMGQTLGRMHLNDQAIDAFKFAISTNSLSDSILASTYSALAQMVGNKKQFEATLEYSEKSIKLAPDQLYANHLKGFALLYLGKYEEAEEAFLKVLELKKMNRNLPYTGFDIEIPDKLIIDGLEKARNKDNSH